MLFDFQSSVLPHLGDGECYFLTLRVVAEGEVLTSPQHSIDRKVTFSHYKTPAAVLPGTSGNGPCISVDDVDRRRQVSVSRHTPRAEDKNVSKIRYYKLTFAVCSKT